MAIDKSQYLDENGYPGTRQSDGSWDGGDTAAILGTVKALTPMAADVAFPMDLPMWSSPKVPTRHPDYTRWYGQPDRFSRDQLIPWLCTYLIEEPRVSEYWVQRSHAERRYLLAWNTRGNGAMEMPEKFPDITGPEVWALWLRISKPWWRHAFLWLFDLETLVNTLLWRWYRKDNVCRNQMLVCLMTQDHSPTITSWLSYHLLNWQDLLIRWENHCKAVGEYPTYDLFQQAYSARQGGSRG